MRRIDHLRVLRDGPEKIEQLGARTMVETVGALVEHEDARIAHQRARDEQHAQLAERERVDRAVGEIAQSEARDDRVDVGELLRAQRAGQVDRVVQPARNERSAGHVQVEPRVAFLQLG